MKMKDIISLTDAELETKGRDLQQELFNLRLQQATGRLEKPSRLRDLKRDVARVKTLLSQRRQKKAA
jgi:large subunit ribosomal protein L29